MHFRGDVQSDYRAPFFIMGYKQAEHPGRPVLFYFSYIFRKSYNFGGSNCMTTIDVVITLPDNYPIFDIVIKTVIARL